MSTKTGINLSVGRYDGTTPYALGMRVTSCKVKKLPLHNTDEAGTATRQVDQTSTGFYYEIQLRGKVKRFTDYITTYCMITAEGNLPSHNIYVDDGIESRGFTGCYVDKCNISGRQNGVVMADITIKALADEVKDLTITEATEAPISKAGVSTISFGGAAKTKWTTWNFAVDNHVQVVATGNGVAATEIYAKEATYSGQVQFVKTAGFVFGFGTSVTNSTVVYTIVDNQSSPVTKTFTFASAKFESNEYGPEELDLNYETVTWRGYSLVIS